MADFKETLSLYDVHKSRFLLIHAMLSDLLFWPRVARNGR